MENLIKNGNANKFPRRESRFRFVRLWFPWGSSKLVSSRSPSGSNKASRRCIILLTFCAGDEAAAKRSKSVFAMNICRKRTPPFYVFSVHAWVEHAATYLLIMPASTDTINAIHERTIAETISSHVTSLRFLPSTRIFSSREQFKIWLMIPFGVLWTPLSISDVYVCAGSFLCSSSLDSIIKGEQEIDKVLLLAA
jgi:hypothetical protein